jgi:hypothetical protein
MEKSPNDKVSPKPFALLFLQRKLKHYGRTKCILGTDEADI